VNDEEAVPVELAWGRGTAETFCAESVLADKELL
jgi:hypothetical protein